MNEEKHTHSIRITAKDTMNNNNGECYACWTIILKCEAFFSLHAYYCRLLRYIDNFICFYYFLSLQFYSIWLLYLFGAVIVVCLIQTNNNKSHCINAMTRENLSVFSRKVHSIGMEIWYSHHFKCHSHWPFFVIHPFNQFLWIICSNHKQNKQPN